MRLRWQASTRVRGLAGLFVIVLAVLTTGALSEKSARLPSPDVPENTLASKLTDFIRVSGPRILLGPNPIQLKGINFSNYYYRDIPTAELLNSGHHTGDDYYAVKRMGFNSIRFAINGDWYADSPSDFWRWLDRNIAWARDSQVFLILDLHTPVKSFWLDPTSEKVSFAIWTDPAVRRKNIELWEEIAKRYKDEPYIAGYDILNEPVTLDADGRQWKTLSQEMIDAIRRFDKNHIIFVGAIYGTNGSYQTKGIERQFLVNDDNVVYDAHFYEPVKYTHQYAAWVEGPASDGGVYPDSEVIVPTGHQRLRVQNRIQSSSAASGTSGWTAYDSGVIALTDEEVVAGLPMLVARGSFAGKVYIDDLRVEEYAPDGSFIRVIVEDPLTKDGAWDWYSWVSKGDNIKFAREQTGRGDDGSISIAAESGDMIAGWSNDRHLFKAKPGHHYRISGYMRGEAIEVGAGSTISLELDFFANPEHEDLIGFQERGQDYLRFEFEKITRFAARHNVPISVLEFGLVRHCFEQGKGGEKWVRDLIQIFDEGQTSFAYWEYRGRDMGIFNETQGTTEASRRLINTLEQAL